MDKKQLTIRIEAFATVVVPKELHVKPENIPMKLDVADYVETETVKKRIDVIKTTITEREIVTVAEVSSPPDDLHLNMDDDEARAEDGTCPGFGGSVAQCGVYDDLGRNNECCKRWRLSNRLNHHGEEIS